MLDRKAIKEAYVIINMLSKENKNKIPKDFIEYLKDNMDKNYKFDISDKIENINRVKLLPDTEKILSVVYTDYLSTEEEKNIIKFKEDLCKKKNKIGV